jgi:hypothetical protein
MINRAPTRIEIKLEDDLIDYEETVNDRKYNRAKIIVEQEFSPEQNNKRQQIYDESGNSLISPYNNNLEITKQNIVSKFSPTPGSINNSESRNISGFKNDVVMK